MKLLMIDNYDSFTYNIVQYLGELGAEVDVFRNDEITLEEIDARLSSGQLDRLVISPGPCSPSEAGISVAAETHLLGMLLVVASHAVDAMHRKAQGATKHRDRDDRGRIENVAHDIFLSSGGFGNELKVLDDRGGCKERTDDGTPLGEGTGLAKSDGVIFQCVPEYLKNVALAAFNTSVDLVALKPLGFVDHMLQAAHDRLFKSGVLAGVNANIGEFKNHESLQQAVFHRLMA